MVDWLARRAKSKERPTGGRVLTAAAMPINLRDKTEIRKQRILRQGWQQDAFQYVQNIPELGFAYRFLSSAAARMRYFPAFVNPDEPNGPPIPVSDVAGLPDGLRDDMMLAMEDFGVGRQAMAPVQEALAYQFGVPGEAYLLGYTDENTGENKYEIRSVDEVMIFDDVYKLRDTPLDPQGIIGWKDLDAGSTYLARMWTPDMQFRHYASSPMRALMDTCEELMILSRDVRSIGRSRLAGGGILKIPEGLMMVGINSETNDGEVNSWFGGFPNAMMVPLVDEGSASSVVPIAVTGTKDELAGLEHMLIDRPYSALAIQLRAEAIGRIATGLDFPREILEGIGDVNHWSGALVSDETFRHHIEPQIIRQVDSLAMAFMRPWLRALDRYEPYWINRACIWYDPVDLVSKPDPMDNAVLLHDRFAISDKALREAGGFKDDDEPSPLEKELRMLQKARMLPPNMVEAIFHAFDPSLTFPPITVPGSVPGLGPSGEIAVTAPPVPPALPAAPAGTAPPTAPPSGDTPSAMPAMTIDPAAFAAQVEAKAERDRLSRRLAQIDSQLRARIQTAAAQQVLRVLDRAGGQVRGRVRTAKYGFPVAERERVADVENRWLAAELGETVVASLGFADSGALLNPDWADLQAMFTGWVHAAQQDALSAARRIAGLAIDDARVLAADRLFQASIQPAWQQLVNDLTGIATRLLFHPGDAREPSIDPATVVPSGVIRSALTRAGGGELPRVVGQAVHPDARTGQTEVLDPARTIDVSARVPPTEPGPPARMVSVKVRPPDGQIGNGAVVSGLLDDAGLEPIMFTWEHLGDSRHPFDPHLALDGTSFSRFDDEKLSNGGDWPNVSFYHPGDHPGCGCDYITTWGDLNEGGA